MSLPETIAINAWAASGPATGELSGDAAKWGSRPGLPHSQAALALGAISDQRRWDDPDVGYGVVLRDSDDPHLSPADRAAAVDAPPAVRRLLAARPGTAVIRWRPDLPSRHLRRYFPDGRDQDPIIGMTAFGVGPARLPRYLTIIGGPQEIPWSVQYALNTRHAVGRLPFTGDQLDNYIEALLSGWAGADIDATAPLVWAVDHGPGDITALMRAVVAEPIAHALNDPRLPGTRYLSAQGATADGLLAALKGRPPALLVTSSHGYTHPGDAEIMRRTLGLPVDRDATTVALDDIDSAIPFGAIWYAQACCSAGSDSPTQYTGLVNDDSVAGRVLSAVAGIGAGVAPAALRLLGRTNPIRALVGHVEPTFDWTLRARQTGQGLGHEIVAALGKNLHLGQEPVGLAFAAYRQGIGVLHTQWAAARQRLNEGDLSARAQLTELRLTALDRQSLVLLGDPTVTLPTAGR